MTRKDYVLIAEAIKSATPANPHALSGVHDAAICVANALSRDNPRFEHTRFLKACGLNIVEQG